MNHDSISIFRVVFGFAFIIAYLFGFGAQAGSSLEVVIAFLSWPFLLPGILRKFIVPGAYGVIATLPVLAVGILIGYLFDRAWHRISRTIAQRRSTIPNVS